MLNFTDEFILIIKIHNTKKIWNRYLIFYLTILEEMEKSIHFNLKINIMTVNYFYFEQLEHIICTIFNKHK